MNANDAPLGCSALLRVAGLPIRYWLSGANPTLFEKVKHLEHDEEVRRPIAIKLAERIGQQLVSNSAISRDDRAFLLAVRRSLHRGDLIAQVSRERFLRVHGLSDADAEVIQALVTMVDRDRAIATRTAGIEADLAQEQHRLLLLPEQICHESRVARALLAPQDPEGPGLGSQLGRQSRRHRCEHEWRRITRAATGSTPRGWLSHVALVRIETAISPPPPVVTEHFTAQWMENVRARRLAMADPPDDWPTPESRLAMNPLHWDEDGHVVSMVVGKNNEQTRVSVRHTWLLDAICTTLADGARTFGELARTLDARSEDEWVALREFVRHLVILGILQPSAPPLVRLEHRATPGQTFGHLASAEGQQGGWVDVYRYAESGISANLARDVQHGMSQVLRLLSLMRDDMPEPYRGNDATSKRSWSMTEILRDEVGAGDTPTSKREDLDIADGWSFPGSSTSGYARLARKIVEGTEHATEVVFDSHLLNECGAASGVLNWPFDCLVRVPAPGAGFTAVLDQIWPPGLLDARFADTLADMNGVVPHIDAYRDFLSRLEQLTGVLFVEVLAPPLSDGAANAVRRPLYTRAWTGDPLNDAYLRSGTSPVRYIPLNAIQIRRIEGVLRAEVNGQPIWPVHHATRSFSPPWDRLARVLLATAPRVFPWNYPRMIDMLTRTTAQPAVPRIVLSGGIVLSPAQWRIPTDHLWPSGASVTAKLRALIRLQHRYSLPRWISLVSENNEPPVPCDLESMYAIRTIEHHTRGRTQMNVIEMLPAPDQFLVIDSAHNKGDRLASQIQLRFPIDESPRALATRIAPDVIAAYVSPHLTRGASMAPSNCRGPPSRTTRVGCDRHQWRKLDMDAKRYPNQNFAGLKEIASQIKDLQAHLSRTAEGLAEAGDTYTCTCCKLEDLNEIILPGESKALSGAELMARLKR